MTPRKKQQQAPPSAGEASRRTTAAEDPDPVLVEWGRLVSAAQVEDLRDLGLDVLEGARGGAYTTGGDGRRYVDCITSGGVYNLGRRRPELMEALKEAAGATDQGNFPLISEEKGDLGRRLARFVGGDFECAVYSVSRGEAFDFACKLARGASGRPGLVTVDGSWFGQTGFALSMSERPGKDRFGPLIPDITSVPFGDLAAAEEAIDGRTAAFCLEPVQAEAGCRVADHRYLRALRRICDDRGVLLVLDETQTGFGRCGARFAFAPAGVTPDVLITGEALAAGAFPICATLVPQRLNEFLNRHPMIHLSTFGGHDVGCVVARRALDLYEEEHPWTNASTAGERLRTGLEALHGERPDAVLGVDGLGLLLAVRLASAEQARAFCRGLAAAGVLAMPGAVAVDSVVLRPSLLIGEAEVDQILAAAQSAAEGL